MRPGETRKENHVQDWNGEVFTGKISQREELRRISRQCGLGNAEKGVGLREARNLKPREAFVRSDGEQGDGAGADLGPTRVPFVVLRVRLQGWHCIPVSETQPRCLGGGFRDWREGRGSEPWQRFLPYPPPQTVAQWGARSRFPGKTSGRA